MAADTWSIGVILFVFLAGYLPFDEPTMSALFRKIQAADFEYPSWFSQDVKDLLNKILNPDPAKRLTLKQITEEEWYNRDGEYKYHTIFHTTSLVTFNLTFFISFCLFYTS